MTRARAGILMLSAGATALVWRFAVANYISLAAMGRPFPLAEAFLSMILAGAVTAFNGQRGWRIVTVAGLQGCFAALAILRTVFVYRGGSDSFLAHAWVSELITAASGPVEWLRITLVAALAMWFWFGGWFLVRAKDRPQSHYSRLDLGLAFFFILFLSKLVAWHKTGIEIHDPLALPLSITFMIFGLLSIGLTRRPGSVQTHFISGRQTVGILLSVIVLLILFSTAALLFYLPYLTFMAEASLAVLKRVGTPIGAVLLAVVQFMFAPRHIRPTPSAPPAGRSGAMLETTYVNTGWMDWVMTIVSYSAAVMAALLGLVAATLLFWWLIRWLWSRTSGRPDRKPGREPDAFWAALHSALRRFLVLLQKKISGLRHGPPDGGAQLFVALSTWGRHSGLPRRHCETPLEYGRRLCRRFPRVKTEIEELVDLFNREVYGTTITERTRLVAAQAAWRRLHSPRHWMCRLTSRLTKPDKPPSSPRRV